jgi:hypothetical protein
MQGGKNRILPKEMNETGSSGTLIGWKSGQTTYVPLWDRMDGAWLLTQRRGMEGLRADLMSLNRHFMEHGQPHA